MIRQEIEESAAKFAAVCEQMADEAESGKAEEVLSDRFKTLLSEAEGLLSGIKEDVEFLKSQEPVPGHDFELVHSEEHYWIGRMKVPGGWIYFRDACLNQEDVDSWEQYQWSSTATFVPDPTT